MEHLSLDGDLNEVSEFPVSQIAPHGCYRDWSAKSVENWTKIVLGWAIRTVSAVWVRGGLLAGFPIQFPP
jgi:hypothetical protein